MHCIWINCRIYTLLCTHWIAENMVVYTVPAALFPALSYAVYTIKEGLPGRWQKVSQYLVNLCRLNPAIMNSTPLKVSFVVILFCVCGLECACVCCVGVVCYLNLKNQFQYGSLHPRWTPTSFPLS